MSEKDVLILAIESSCDETAASVVKNGRTILSNVISSQIALHTLYGGVVPEIASRKHIEKINQVVEEALTEADVTLEDLDAVGASLEVMERDSKKMRGDRPFQFTNIRGDENVDKVVEWIKKSVLLEDL